MNVTFPYSVFPRPPAACSDPRRCDLTYTERPLDAAPRRASFLARRRSSRAGESRRLSIGTFAASHAALRWSRGRSKSARR